MRAGYQLLPASQSIRYPSIAHAAEDVRALLYVASMMLPLMEQRGDRRYRPELYQKMQRAIELMRDPARLRRRWAEGARPDGSLEFTFTPVAWGWLQNAFVNMRAVQTDNAQPPGFRVLRAAERLAALLSLMIYWASGSRICGPRGGHNPGEDEDWRQIVTGAEPEFAWVPVQPLGRLEDYLPPQVPRPPGAAVVRAWTNETCAYIEHWRTRDGKDKDTYYRYSVEGAIPEEPGAARLGFCDSASL
jgi:hypothetical protein